MLQQWQNVNYGDVEHAQMRNLLTGLANQISNTFNKRQIVTNVPTFTGKPDQIREWIQQFKNYVFIAQTALLTLLP